MTENFSYRNLQVYQLSKDFVLFVYKLLHQFPKEETYALCDQLRRSSVSVPSNIVEGMSRTSLKEQLHFIEIAYGSLCEAMCQLELAHELQMIGNHDLQKSEEIVKSIAQMLSGLRNSRLQTINR